METNVEERIEQTGSVFSNTMSVEQIKQINGNLPFLIKANPKKEGIAFFSCGSLVGHVAKKAWEKIQQGDKDTVFVVSHVKSPATDEYPMAYDGYVLHELNMDNAIVW
jgi:hypothetical protein